MIVPMARVEVAGPRDALEEVLAFLQARGVLELRAALPGAPAAGEGARLEGVRARIEDVLGKLPAPAAGPAALQGPAPADAAFLPWLDAEARALAAADDRAAALRDEHAAADRLATLIEALAPLDHALAPALEPELHGLVLRTDPAALALLAAEVHRLAGPDALVRARPLDAGRTGVLLVVPRTASRALSALLFERGVEEIRLPAAFTGRGLVDTLLYLAARRRTLPAELAAAETEAARRAAALRAVLEPARAEVLAALARFRAGAGCAMTRYAFVVSGYAPAEQVPALRAAASGAFGDRIAVLSRPPTHAEWPDVPVVLRNRAWLRPFERLLALVPSPRYGSLDPTPWLAVGFPLFFGLVLGDVAFGAAGIAVALLARARGLGGGIGRDLAVIALACSISAAVFGLAFGEALGELGQHVGLHPLLLDRRKALLAFLGLAVAVGAVHVALGMVLGVVSSVRAGERREALARAAKPVLLAAGGLAAAAALGKVPHAVLAPSLAVGAAALALAVAGEGPMAALELVLGLGNVLSYARLMALGLASAMLAEVANGIGRTLQPAAAGLALAVLLHAVNFTLGLVSPAVAALRLHYVEFFERFYEPGGPPWRPFALG